MGDAIKAVQEKLDDMRASGEGRWIDRETYLTPGCRYGTFQLRAGAAHPVTRCTSVTRSSARPPRSRAYFGPR